MSLFPGADPDTVLLYLCGDVGDAGAAVTVNDLLVGMIRGDFPQPGRCPIRIWNGHFMMRKIPLRDRPEVTSMTTIVDDLDAKGGPGAGFTPTPG